MKYLKLRGTDLYVSKTCLGTVGFGTDVPYDQAAAQINRFLDLGGNFLDTGHAYADWAPGIHGRNESEKAIGKWIKNNGNRGSFILTTKGAHPYYPDMHIPRVNPDDIRKDLDESLEYLNTDYIDMYFLHRDDPNVPISDILYCLDAAQKQGKIRYYGCSNWSLDRMMEAERYAKQNGLQGFSVNQLMWSLADVNFYNLPDQSLVPMDEQTYKYHQESGMNVMAYMAIAKGYFALKWLGGKLPDSIASVYDNPSNQQIYDKAFDLVKKGEFSYLDLSFMYFMAENGFHSVPVAAYDNLQQLDEGLASFDKPVPYDLIHEIREMKKFVYYHDSSQSNS